MKIISLNVQIGNTKTQQIADFLDEQDPDHVFLQEVLMSDGTDAAQQIHDLMKHPYKSVKTDKVEAYTTSQDDTYTQGMSILSRGNNIVTKPVELLNVAGDKHTRVAQFAQIDYFCESYAPSNDSYGYDFINVHFANRPGNVVQLKQVLESANESHSYPIIVGDFNMNRQVFYETKRWWGNAYESSIEFINYVSYLGSEEFSQIDICLIPRGMKFRNITTFEGLSDHNAVLYEIDDSGFNPDDTMNYVYPGEWAEQ
ncbi:endonuclease/exonuclease/phosphatase family protein [Candidatus Saccharibacteria bacterium]|nr:endonuclease/exonuclease/phosphatase family protein [Candidatus Saccharibacteria bacterium]